MIFLCLFSVSFAAVIQNSQPIESNAASVADQIASEDKKTNDDNSDLETAEFKRPFARKFGFGVPVAVPVQPVYVQQPYIQPVPVPVYQPVQYQHVHTPDCGCNGGGHNQHSSYGYNYNYHYSY